jgi:lysophospholipase L1-like esterase
MQANSRRIFIRGAALTGIAACCLPPLGSFADECCKPPEEAPRLKDGAIILFQGDSITDGNRGRNSDPNHILGHGYQFSIGSRLSADFPEKRYTFYNRGISGNKVVELEKRWQTDTLDLKPDLLSILIGVNDSTSIVANWEPIVSIEKYNVVYNSLLEQTRLLFPEAVLVLCEPFIAPGSRTSENWDAFQIDMQQRQAIVKKLAAKHNAVFVGFQEVFNNAFQKAPVEYWIWDGVHPTIAGHELMAREWMKQVSCKIRF